MACMSRLFYAFGFWSPVDSTRLQEADLTLLAKLFLKGVADTGGESHIVLVTASRWIAEKQVNDARVQVEALAEIGSQCGAGVEAILACICKVWIEIQVVV